MGIHLEAVYEQGVLRPLEPLALAEHQRVHVTVEERMSPAVLPVMRKRSFLSIGRDGQ